MKASNRSRVRRAAESSVAQAKGSSAVAQSKALFFAAAGMSFVMSVYLFFSGEREQGIFVGIWVPSILTAGLFLIGGASDE